MITEQVKQLSIEELKPYYLEYRARTRKNKYDKKYNQKRVLVTSSRKVSLIDTDKTTSSRSDTSENQNKEIKSDMGIF